MKSNIKIMIILLHLISTILFGQFIPNRFQHISTSDGLSQGTVNTVLQDRTGFLWFGTEDGLNRYDGYEFKVYTVSNDDPNTISNNYIWSLAEDSEGNIWIATDGGGLNKFDPVTNKFTKFFHDNSDSSSISSNVIQSLLFDSKNNLWVGTWGGGVCIYDFSTDSFKRVLLNSTSDTNKEAKFIWAIYEDNSGTIWIGTDNEGLFYYDPITKRLIDYKVKDNEISNSSVTSICEDENNDLWVGTFGKGLNRIEKSSKNVYKYGSYPKWNNSITDMVILKIIKDSIGQIWVASMEKGIFLYDQAKDTFINYNFDIHDPLSINSDNVRSLYEDRSHNLWIGTMGEGLNKLIIKNNHFFDIKNEINNPNSLRENFVFSVLADSFGNVWIGTYGGGISKFIKSQNKFIFYTHDPSKSSSLGGNNVRIIYEDSNNDIWIGNYPGGLSRYNRTNDTFTNYTKGNSQYALNNDMVRTIFEDSKKRLWIGTNGGGLSYFNRSTNKFHIYRTDPDDPNSISGDAILSINEDLSGNLWIGTYGNGVNRFDSEMGLFERYVNQPENDSSLSNNIVTEIYVSNEGTLWIGTWGGGINIYDPETNSFYSITTDDGLASNVICGILEDDNQNIWVSTFKGISKIEKKSTIIKNYYQSDGLLPGEFNPSARSKSKDGWVYFGSNKGVNYFHPDSINDSEYQPRVVITSYKKHNIEVPLDKNIEFIDTVYLSYDEDNFSFEFSSLDYTNTRKNLYSYKLENFDKDWVESGTRRYANYTHLDPGEYLFKVRGTNHDGVWSENYAQVFMIISPPFWGTWYFKIFMFLLLTITGYYFYRMKIRNYEREKLAQEKFTEKLIESQEQERKRIASGLHDSLGQNLLIVKNRALLGINSQSLDNAKKELEEISSSASQALDEVRQIAYNLHPYQLTRLGLTKAVESLVSRINGINDIEFNSRIDNIDDIFPKSSEINIYRILQECINNVLKYSEAKNVQVSVLLFNNFITLEVTDNGIGFDYEEVKSKGFGLQNIEKRVSLLRGTLKIESNKGTGTKIFVKIPFGKDE